MMDGIICRLEKDEAVCRYGWEDEAEEGEFILGRDEEDNLKLIWDKFQSDYPTVFKNKLYYRRPEAIPEEIKEVFNTIVNI